MSEGSFGEGNGPRGYIVRFGEAVLESWFLTWLILTGVLMAEGVAGFVQGTGVTVPGWVSSFVEGSMWGVFFGALWVGTTILVIGVVSVVGYQEARKWVAAADGWREIGVPVLVVIGVGTVGIGFLGGVLVGLASVVQVMMNETVVAETVLFGLPLWVRGVLGTSTVIWVVLTIYMNGAE